MKRRKRSGHPRVNCLVPGCRRGTTTVPPEDQRRGVQYLCGTHWRQVPRSLKNRMAKYRRRARAAERRHDYETANRWHDLDVAIWKRITDQFLEPEQFSGGFPPALRAELERDGLI